MARAFTSHGSFLAFVLVAKLAFEDQRKVPLKGNRKTKNEVEFHFVIDFVEKRFDQRMGERVPKRKQWQG